MPGLSKGLMTHPIHNGSVVCHSEGIVEPITLALFLAAEHDRRRGDYLTAAAVTSDSPAFLMRVYIALGMVAELVNEARRDWGRLLWRSKFCRISKRSFSFTAFTRNDRGWSSLAVHS
jgi:hypothetical protein